MLFGKRESRSPIGRPRGAYRPRLQGLERRILLVIDLGGVTPPALPAVATAPYGVEMAGAQSSGGAGFSVSDVGDINGDGFDDFLIGGPTVVNTGGVLSPGAGNNSRVYLLFGSKQSQDGTVDWKTLAAQNRIGDLGQLGNSQAAQQNPLNGQPTFPYDGVTFFTSQTNGAQLGASVTVVRGLAGGANALLIGAPGARDANGANPRTGRAYLIYGGASLLNAVGKTIDLDSTNQNVPGVNIVTFVNSAATSDTGRAVAGVGDVIADAVPDFAIGAPTATIGGQINTGAVYLLSGAAFTTPQTRTVDLATVGQNGGPVGVIFTGAATGDRAGQTLSTAGDFDGAISSANLPIDDLLIGAPNHGASGAVYLVYGARNLPSLTTVSNGINIISLANVGTPAANTPVVAGIVFTGTAAGDQTGLALATAGDFNQDGFGDILIGSPGYLGGTGRVDLIYGTSVNNASLTGTIPLNNIPTALQSATFIGANAGDQAGFAVTAVGPIQTNRLNEIAIGAPSFNGGLGTVYVIPGNLGLFGTYSLATAEAQPLAATQFTITNTVPGTTAFLGASLSGRLTNASQTLTADADTLGDLIIGAPALSATNGRGFDGGVYILEGAFIPLQTPVSTTINVTIGVGTPNPPFSINATTPAALNIYIFSNAGVTPPFNPVTDIDPASIVVNGVAFPTATIAADPVDENNDGIPDAIVTITPRSNLNLANGTVTFTVSGRTLAGSANPNKRFIGSASVSVTGGSGGNGGGGPAAGVPIGLVNQTAATYPFGPETFVPSVQTLSEYNYKPIPLGVAIHQFLPPNGFGLRERKYFNPSLNVNAVSKLPRGEHGIWTLSHKVFTQTKFKPGHVVKFTHKVPVVPNYRQTERFGPTLSQFGNRKAKGSGGTTN